MRLHYLKDIDSSSTRTPPAVATSVAGSNRTVGIHVIVEFSYRSQFSALDTIVIYDWLERSAVIALDMPVRQYNASQTPHTNTFRYEVVTYEHTIVTEWIQKSPDTRTVLILNW
jgi:hypothetical protein